MLLARGLENGAQLLDLLLQGGAAIGLGRIGRDCLLAVLAELGPAQFQGLYLLGEGGLQTFVFLLEVLKGLGEPIGLCAQGVLLGLQGVELVR